MSVEVGQGVIYYWYDVPEDQLEDIENWTEAAAKIRSVTADVKRIAEATAPVGRARDDQFRQIKSSHYQAAGIRRDKHYQQVVGNRAPHALWVHEGTLQSGMNGMTVSHQGKWLGPVMKGTGIGEVNLRGGPPKSVKRRGDTARWRAYPSFFYFQYYQWRGQKANRWLERAGPVAYRMPGNH